MGVHGGVYDPSILLSANVASISGGTNTVTSYTDGSGNAWRVYTFLESGNFTTDVVSKCDVLVVAGGGGGGAWVGAGAGAGGMIVRPGKILSPGTYTITIGAGGAGDYNPGGYAGMPAGANGQDTTFDSVLTAKGGGKGPSHTHAGSSGGSGCGGTPYASNRTGLAETQTGQAGDSGTYGYGNAGGNGASYVNDPYAGGGGGGAGGAGEAATGTNSSNCTIGDGGIGKTNDYRTGANVYYAGGAGGGHHDGAPVDYGEGTISTGGGGAGNGATGAGTYDGQNGTNNTGGGGGGAGRTGGLASRGGTGGSGIVVVRLGAV